MVTRILKLVTIPIISWRFYILHKRGICIMLLKELNISSLQVMRRVFFLARKKLTRSLKITFKCRRNELKWMILMMVDPSSWISNQTIPRVFFRHPICNQLKNNERWHVESLDLKSLIQMWLLHTYKSPWY